MAKAKSTESRVKGNEDLNFHYEPKSQAQVEAEELWRRSRVMFLVGPAGTGKTAAALGMALREVLRSETGKVMLARPMVTCDEETGFLPGDLAQKLGPWMGAFHDVFSCQSTSDWTKLEKTLDKRLEMVPVGMLRGRTIRNGVLICDEVQNCTYSQLQCILTRVGKGGRVLLCGDPDQSDRFSYEESPLLSVAHKLKHLDTVSMVEFDGIRDQLRDPLVSEMLACL